MIQKKESLTVDLSEGSFSGVSPAYDKGASGDAVGCNGEADFFFSLLMMSFNVVAICNYAAFNCGVPGSTTGQRPHPLAPWGFNNPHFRVTGTGEAGPAPFSRHGNPC